MAKTLDIIDRQLELGQTKVISSDGGRFIDYVELLFSPTTKVQFAPLDDKTAVEMTISDNNLSFPEVSCVITKETLRDYIIYLKAVYSEILNDNSIKEGIYFEKN